MALIYTGRADEIGQIQLPAELLKAKLRTILGRLKDAAERIEKMPISALERWQKLIPQFNNKSTKLI